MEQIMIYFLDTYAFIELIKGNERYKQFINGNFRTTILNLYELYFNILKEFNERKAKEYFEKYYLSIIEIKKEQVFKAAKFKLENKKNNLSYVDALGYEISKFENFKFLTGEKEFENMPNIEFVR